MTSGTSVAAITMKLPSRSAGSKLPLNPFELAFRGQLPNFSPRLGRNHAQLDAGLEQAADLFERDRSRADQQALAAVEF